MNKLEKIVWCALVAVSCTGTLYAATPTKPQKASPAGKDSSSDNKPKEPPYYGTNQIVKVDGTKTYWKTRFGPVMIEDLSKPGDALPKFNIETDHYKIYSEIKAATMDPLRDIGMLMEAAYPIRKNFFGSAPSDKILKVELYATGDNFLAGMRVDGLGGPGFVGGGYAHSGTRKAYLYWQPAGLYFTRYLLLHETTHQFHLLTGACPTMPVEGVADYLAMHKWDGTNFVAGVVAPSQWLLGKKPDNALKLLKDTVDKNGKPKDIKEMIGISKGYDGQWAVIHFLINRDPVGFKEMFFNMPKVPLNDAWKKLYGSETLKPEVYDDYTNWLTKMTTYTGNDVKFISWSLILGGDPTAEASAKIEKLDGILGKAAPPSLTNLQQKVKSIFLSLSTDAPAPANNPAIKASSGPKSEKSHGTSAPKAGAQTKGDSVRAKVNAVWSESFSQLCKEVSTCSAPQEKIDEAMQLLLGCSITAKAAPVPNDVKSLLLQITITASNLPSMVQGSVSLSMKPESAGKIPEKPFPFQLSRTQPALIKAVIPIEESAGANTPVHIDINAKVKGGNLSFPLKTTCKWRRGDSI